ncbi:helix-turn-helix transcriptional regulator [Thiomicrorhabdus sp.]|uniref:helix-turn-helix domain-containing protein n=1 Tax=Thiomicrorhabdus sp. TaxID=2039724 RepID=UPI0029C7AA31|nr:helix-turn-helix transcriptional regulator [Thiomicrorhabdus sp.]
MKKSVWQEQYQTLNSELRAMRKAAGLSQVQLAQKLDKPQSYVSKYENGDRYLNFIEVLDVCRACNSSVALIIEKLGYQAVIKKTV